MYKVPYFTEEDEEKVYAFMVENPFAIVTGFGEDTPVATHVPLIINKENKSITLTGHLKKETDHHKAFSKNKNVLVIFSGPNCYVSASWYSQKTVASTWNYIAVHAKGEIEFVNEEITRDIIRELTNRYEPPQSEAAFDKLSNAYVDSMVKAIVGFNIKLNSLSNVFKLSQNRDLISRQNIAEMLLKNDDSGSKVIAGEMRKRFNE
jgi:transcriptional regulator